MIRTLCLSALFAFPIATASAQPAAAPVELEAEQERRAEIQSEPDTAAPGGEAQAVAAETPPVFRTEQVTLNTAKGPIVIALEVERAPITAKNFLRYVREGRFNGMSFYRASNIAEGYGLIQGGTQGNPKMVLPAIRHEPTTQTGLSHTAGTISMAMGAPGTATGDFFIVVGDLVSLDAADGAPGFAAFGKVVEGMDVVLDILDDATDPNEGTGSMRGEILAKPVQIRSAEKGG
ncbi:peptidylprolyl isomerase [Pacificimonas sp. WHA3]|uniref:peptidylprolyl isomerase n=1 Tax=Pacificimonas pallii TaxID=2827236 RepID=A0ABS6SCM5_9SPHN|nr:peptidylprolyl isomerase [Pacificimonas pallii]MBV7256105.1 peptidylprolyl isomerase [Pacificimonas pallii]